MRAGQIAPRKATKGLRQQAWWVMRRRVVFTVHELLATIATGTERDAESNIGRYVRMLEKVGMLKIDGRTPPTSVTSNGCIRYRVVIDNGRKAPVWRQRNGGVYDPNTGDCYEEREAVND